MHIRTTIIASTALAFVAMVAEAHSWADCVDWRFKDPTAKPSWDAKDGTCHGYAREYPLKKNIRFGDLDSDSPNRHYQQDGALVPCSDGKSGIEKGADETRKNPISAAYFEGDPQWGPMAKARAGDIMCIRWPSKTHGSETGLLPVSINMPIVTLDKDPDQKTFSAASVITLPFNNCSTIAGDGDHTPCGGCFPVPGGLKTGNYVIQWRWELTNGQKKEFYTSCWDLGVTARDESSTTGTPKSVPTLDASTNIFGTLVQA
ncbi:hypothetical protein BGZ65_010468 [Modicella reniformis]|uniref:Chitin-binding type-4 domain-containing protein n=1 Tax=Modicella reniformis TaxID=1440133 RepID=A0A9P6LRU9_9FUNG|nr:hypothetical protein BGZ65_010468 [Modicella reniformis]